MIDAHADDRRIRPDGPLMLDCQAHFRFGLRYSDFARLEERLLFLCLLLLVVDPGPKFVSQPLLKSSFELGCEVLAEHGSEVPVKSGDVPWDVCRSVDHYYDPHAFLLSSSAFFCIPSTAARNLRANVLSELIRISVWECHAFLLSSLRYGGQATEKLLGVKPNKVFGLER